MGFSLEGRVAIVTGSTTGLGKAIALGLGEAGAKVGINYYHNTQRAERAVAEFEQAGVETKLVRANVIDEDEVDRLFSEVEAAFGPVDIVVPNATPDQPLKPIEQYEWSFYQSMLDFFIKSPYLLTRRALPNMKQRSGAGSSTSPARSIISRSRRSVLTWRQRGDRSAGRGVWRRELAPFGITVNMVAPGWIPVERHENDPQSMKDEYLANDSGRQMGRSRRYRGVGRVLRQRGSRLRDGPDPLRQRRQLALVRLCSRVTP